LESRNFIKRKGLKVNLNDAGTVDSPKSPDLTAVEMIAVDMREVVGATVEATMISLEVLVTIFKRVDAREVIHVDFHMMVAIVEAVMRDAVAVEVVVAAAAATTEAVHVVYVTRIRKETVIEVIHVVFPMRVDLETTVAEMTVAEMTVVEMTVVETIVVEMIVVAVTEKRGHQDLVERATISRPEDAPEETPAVFHIADASIFSLRACHS
jgi:hypothetical protein